MCLEATTATALTGSRVPGSGDDQMTPKESEAGAAAEFWELLEPVNRKVYNFIRKTSGFSQDADDIFQETVLQAFRYFRTFRRGAKFEGWLFAIAHNELRKHFRKAAGAPGPLESEAVGGPGPTRREDLVREVFRFAEALPPRRREVFFLFYDSGFSMGEISEITGLREGNIKFILHQARTNLKTIMGEKNG